LKRFWGSCFLFIKKMQGCEKNKGVEYYRHCNCDNEKNIGHKKWALVRSIQPIETSVVGSCFFLSDL
jgi:hypothetical protein